MIYLDIIAYLIAIMVSLPLIILSGECFLSLLPARKRVLGNREPCAVVVPAHNEEAGINSTLQNILGQLRDGDRLVVVADNCTDRTAAIAKDFGAEVVVRSDLTKRGKGYALDAGVNHLKESVSRGAQAPRVVIIMDADCLFEAGSLDTLVRIAAEENRPQQALYLMHAGSSATPTSRLSAFAFLTKNLVRPRGMDRIGLSVPLTGSGMAFPWEIIKDLELGTSEIVEDLELGLRLVIEGRGPHFCETARVDSYFPSTDSAARAQRTRWEHGYLGQMRRKLPKLFYTTLAGNRHALAAGLDLLIPPLSLLVMVAAMTGAFLSGHYVVSEHAFPFQIFIASCCLASASLFAVWYRFGRRTISLAEILWIPVYAGRKISMYLAVPFRAEREWKRTER
jgi:cellulose synthase/poly-beta-1,6-N-acetylglucosamine synthase-like glycosyltransferase